MKFKKLKKRIKLNKMQVIAGFAGICIALCLWIGYSTPADILYSSNATSYDNTNSGMASNNVQDALDELYQCVEDKNATSVTLNVGDYVQMTPTLSSYTTEPKYTGYDTPETINPQELNLWRIIRVNSDGTYDAVSEYVSSTKITFRGTKGYQSFVGYLNVLASKYENTKFTVGSRYMGYDGQTEFIIDTSYFDGTSLKAGEEWISSTSGTPVEEYLGRGDELYITDYNLVKVAYGNASDSVKANEVGTTTITTYWLGSRYYQYNSLSSFYFMGKLVRTGTATYSYLCGYEGGSWGGTLGSSYALRPIITLRSGLTATGTGTSSDPYVLR